MKVLITGASGMVGRNLLNHFSAREFEILAPSSKELELRDAAAVHNWLERERPEAIVHLAAVVGGIQANIDEPTRFLSANIDMAMALFNSARRLGIKRILNVASSCMYPRDMVDPLTPDLILTAPLEPTNEGYALSKIIGERLLAYMVREDQNLIYRTIMPCNLYGEYDHFDLRKSHLVPAAVMKMVDAQLTSAPAVTVWGDGTARREFMFSADLADFIWWALPKLDHLPLLLNVGTGIDYTVREYYETIGALIGYRGKLIFDLNKPAGMKRKLLDVSVVNALGWKALTSLETGLLKTIEHHAQVFGLPNLAGSGT